MNQDIKIVPEEIHLFHIDVIESSIKETGNKKEEEFELRIANTIMHNLKDERVKIGLYIDLNTDDSNDSDSNQAHFTIDFHYHIENLSNFYKFNDKNQPIFSSLLITTVLGLSLSTARGIIYERLSNSNFRGVILPVLDAKMILSEKRKK